MHIKPTLPFALLGLIILAAALPQAPHPISPKTPPHINAKSRETPGESSAYSQPPSHHNTSHPSTNTYNATLVTEEIQAAIEELVNAEIAAVVEEEAVLRNGTRSHHPFHHKHNGTRSAKPPTDHPRTGANTEDDAGTPPREVAASGGPM